MKLSNHIKELAHVHTPSKPAIHCVHSTCTYLLQVTTMIAPTLNIVFEDV